MFRLCILRRNISYFSGTPQIGLLGLGGFGGSTGIGSQSSSILTSQTQGFNQNVGGFNSGIAAHRPIFPGIGLNGPLLQPIYNPYIQG